MIRFLEMLFYVMYRSFKHRDRRKNKDNYEISFIWTAILGVSLIGTLFLNSIFLLSGVKFDVGVFMLIVSNPEYGTPLVFIAPIITGIFFYQLCVCDGKYLNFPKKHPEVTIENLSKYDQNYMLWPVVISFSLLCFSVWVTFATGRGI